MRQDFLDMTQKTQQEKQKFFSFFLTVLGFEPKANTLSHSINPFFVMGFFKIGSCTLFARDWLQTS
jgi:hypothetical protein